MSRRSWQITPDLLLRAYAAGIFPMAESAESDELRWFDPPLRALIPLDERFHVSHSLAKTIRKRLFSIKIDTAFKAVMEGCAEKTPARPVTWINDEIIGLYTRLFNAGYAHSVEVWQGEALVGGLYGVALGSAFFGESMFNRARDASKIALVHLVALLRARGFTLLDTQFQTDHLSHFGTIEITRSNYLLLLAAALEKQASLFRINAETEWPALLARVL